MEQSSVDSFRSSMIRQYRNTVPSTVITNTTAETAFDVFPTIRANTLKVGSVVDFHFYGIYSTDVIAPTLIGRARFGGLSGVLALSTGTLSTLVGNLSDFGFFAQGRFLCRTIGATGTLECQGFTSLQTAVGLGLATHMPNSAVITVDTTVDAALVATLQMGTASPNNKFQARILTVDIWE